MKFGLNAALHDAARKQHEAGALEAAEQGYRQVLAMDPAHFESLHMLGMLAGQTGHHDEALALADQAIAARPDVAEAHVNRGIALANLGRDDEAAQSFQSALDISPGHPLAQSAMTNLRARTDAAKAAKT